MSPELKLVLFLVVIFGVIPAGIIAARANDYIRTGFFMLMLFFTCRLIVIHLDPMPLWTGTVRGYPFSLVDICAVIVLGSMVGKPGMKVNLFPYGIWLYFLYLISSALSITNALYVPQACFELVKMGFMYLFFIAAYNYLANIRNFWPVIYAICIGIYYMFLVGMSQKYVFHSHHQIPSTMPHQNSLSMYNSLFGCLLLGILLNEKKNLFQTLFLGGAFACSAVLVVFTLSRGGMLCYGMAITLTVMLSITFQKISPAKIAVIAGIILVGSVVLGIAAPRIINRFESAPESSKITRVVLAQASRRLANEYFLGIGLNNFSAYSGNKEGYLVDPDGTTKIVITKEVEDFGAIVETIYLLVAAECGWVTMGILLVWFLYYFYFAFWEVIAYRNQPCGGIAVGVFGGLFSNYFQSAFEWVLKQQNNFYQLMFIFAVVAVLRYYKRNRDATSLSVSRPDAA